MFVRNGWVFQSLLRIPDEWDSQVQVSASFIVMELTSRLEVTVSN